MKKISNVLFAATFLFFLMGVSAAKAQQIAHIASDSIVPKMASYQYAMKEMEAYSINIQKQIQGKEAEMEAFYMDVVDKKQKGLLTPIQEKEAEKKLQEMQAAFQKFTQELEAQAYKKEQELIAPVYEEYNKAVKEVCKENNYSYILDKKFILYSDGGIDATAKVKTKLKI